MTNQETTRRRIIQGVSAIGATSLVGSSFVAAQEETPTAEALTAVRVAHMSPDAPAVDVLLDGNSVLQTVEFGDVSDYAEVQPGSYQLQVVTNQAEEAVYEQQIDVPGGQVVTAVAYGLVADAPAETPTGETPTAGTPTEATPGAGTPTAATPTEATPAAETATDGTQTAEGTPTDGTPAAETPTAGTPTNGAPTDDGGGLGVVAEGLPYGEARSFTIDGGGYTVLVRPTDDEAATPDGGTATETPAGTPTGETPTGETPTGETPTGETPTGETPAGTPTGETPTGETPAGTPTAETPAGTPTGETPTGGDSTTEQRPFQVELLVDDITEPPEGQVRIRAFHAVPDIDEATIVVVPRGQGQGPGQGQGQGPGQGQGQGPQRSVDLSVDSGTVYSGFAAGFFDTQPAETPEEETPATEEETPATEERPPLDFVVVQTATDGERADGSSGAP